MKVYKHKKAYRRKGKIVRSHRQRYPKKKRKAHMPFVKKKVGGVFSYADGLFKIVDKNNEPLAIGTGREMAKDIEDKTNVEINPGTLMVADQKDIISVIKKAYPKAEGYYWEPSYKDSFEYVWEDEPIRKTSAVTNLTAIQNAYRTGGPQKKSQHPFEHELLGVLSDIEMVNSSQTISPENKELALNNLNKELEGLKKSKLYKRFMSDKWEQKLIDEGRLLPR